MTKKLYLVITLFFSFLMVKTASAHKVSVFGYREGNCIIGESYFSDGSPCKKCLVEIYNSQGKKIAQTKTDEKGDFKVKVNYTGPVKIKLIGGEGHLAEYELEGVKEETQGTTAATSSNQEETTAVSSSTGTPGSVSISKQELKEIVREVVAEETEGIKSMLLDLKKEMDKAKIHDVIGGIGYIFGIWGIIALLRTRKKV